MLFLAANNEGLELVNKNQEIVRNLGLMIEARIIASRIVSNRYACYEGEIIDENLKFMVVTECNNELDRALGTFMSRRIWIWSTEGKLTVDPSHYGSNYRGPR